jgi:hypothetical protein
MDKRSNFLAVGLADREIFLAGIVGEGAAA